MGYIVHLFKGRYTRLDELDKMADFGNLIDQYETYILVNALSVLSKQTKNMVQKYDAVITNPPYMGAGNMESKLSQYANKFYPNTKSDLSTICMEQGLSLCKNNGLVSMINIPVWMFLTSYEKFRNNLIKDHTFVNMVHPGRGVFGSDFGSVSFVIWKAKIHAYKAVYARLFEQSVEVKTNEIREQAFLEGKGRFVAKQDGFSKIPGVPIAYWVGDNFISAFSNSPRMNSFGKPVEGIKTGDNEKYLRLWFEPAKGSVKLVDDGDYNYHWMPMTKGGAFRKWYGNLDYVVAWGIEGQILKNAAGSSLSNSSLFFSPGLTWTYVTSGQFSMRMVEDYILHNNKGPACYVCSDSKYFLLALMNSVVVAYMLTFLAPTIDCKPGNIANIPVIYEENYKDRIDELSQQCHCISKADWDCCETSWEFKKNPLI